MKRIVTFSQCAYSPFMGRAGHQPKPTLSYRCKVTSAPLPKQGETSMLFRWDKKAHVTALDKEYSRHFNAGVSLFNAGYQRRAVRLYFEPVIKGLTAQEEQLSLGQAKLLGLARYFKAVYRMNSGGHDEALTLLEYARQQYVSSDYQARIDQHVNSIQMDRCPPDVPFAELTAKARR